MFNYCLLESIILLITYLFILYLMVDPKKLKLKVIGYEKFRDITKSIQIVALSNIAELKENIC